MRGTFANIRLRNGLVGVEGGSPAPAGGEQMSIYDAAERYRAEGAPLIVIAGKEYGSAPATGRRRAPRFSASAVIAESYERIHRSNLVGMGVLPLQFADGESAETLGLTGRETFTIRGSPTCRRGRT